MKKLDEALEAYLKHGEFFYCFEINKRDCKAICLTSASKPIKINEIVFSEHSGLDIKEGIFNDSAQNCLILEGIFEVGGITQKDDLLGSAIKIMLYFPALKSFYHFLSYECLKQENNGLKFTLYLKSAAEKYNKSILKPFSKTCRAKFGDHKCKIDKEFYASIYRCSNFTARTFFIENCQQDDGYYVGGEAIFSGGFSSIILSHNGKMIEIDQDLPSEIKDCAEVKLIAGCDKSFLTCCKRYNNAVNFRGEPFVPENNILKGF